jgi:hypothetical protein
MAAEENRIGIAPGRDYQPQKEGLYRPRFRMDKEILVNPPIYHGQGIL